jgi:hypothetical protein
MLGSAARKANEPDPVDPARTGRTDRGGDANRLGGWSSGWKSLSSGVSDSCGPGPGAAGIVGVPACRLHDYIGPGQRREDGFRVLGCAIRADVDEGPWFGRSSAGSSPAALGHQSRQRSITHLNKNPQALHLIQIAHLWLRFRDSPLTCNTSERQTRRNRCNLRSFGFVRAFPPMSLKPTYSTKST